MLRVPLILSTAFETETMFHSLKKAPGGVHSRQVVESLPKTGLKQMKDLPEGDLEPTKVSSLIDYSGEARYTVAGCDGMDIDGPGGFSLDPVRTGSEEDFGRKARIGLEDIGGGQAGMTIIGGRGDDRNSLEDVIGQEHLSDKRIFSKPFSMRPKHRNLSKGYEDEEDSNEMTGLLDPKKLAQMRCKTHYGSA